MSSGCADQSRAARAGSPAARSGTAAGPRIGASRNTGLSASRGVTSSFWTNFTPSAISWAQPWNAPAYIGPSRPCMCAITLCSVCPTISGSVRNATTTAATRMTTSSQTGITDVVVRFPASAARAEPVGRAWAPTRSEPVRPAAASGRAWRPTRRATRPAPSRPATALATRDGEHELLAQRMALELGRQQQRLHVVVAGEVDVEHLVRLALGPGRARVHADDRVDRRARRAGPRVRSSTPCRYRWTTGARRREAVGELVDGAQPVEEVQGQRRVVARGPDARTHAPRVRRRSPGPRHRRRTHGRRRQIRRRAARANRAPRSGPVSAARASIVSHQRILGQDGPMHALVAEAMKKAAIVWIATGDGARVPACGACPSTTRCTW